MILATLSPNQQRHSTLQNKLFSKWIKRNPPQHSRMVMAAAKEKVVRRYRTDQVHSEDLTASQFASIAGIQIKCVTEEFEESHSLTTDATPLALHSAAMVRSQSTPLGQNRLAIWDSAFWENKDKNQKPSKTTSSVNFHDTDASDGQLIVHGASNNTATTTSVLHRSSSSPPCHHSCNVIRRGRFRIVVCQGNHPPDAVNSHRHCCPMA